MIVSDNLIETAFTVCSTSSVARFTHSCDPFCTENGYSRIRLDECGIYVSMMGPEQCHPLQNIIVESVFCVLTLLLGKLEGATRCVLSAAVD